MLGRIHVNNELRKTRGPKTNNKQHNYRDDLVGVRLAIELFFEARLQVSFGALFCEAGCKFFACEKDQLERVSNNGAEEDAFEDAGDDVGRIMNHQVDARTRDEKRRDEQHPAFGFFEVVSNPEEQRRGH